LLRIWTATDWQQLPAVPAAVAIVLLNAAGLVFTHVLRRFMHQHGWQLLSIPHLALRIVAASLVLALPLAQAMAFTPVSAMQLPDSWLQGVPSRWNIDLLPALTLTVNVCNWGLIFATWLIIYFTAVRVRERRVAELRQSEVTRALQHAELQLLKSQLNPHFLFNALNTVRFLITDDPQKAQIAVTRLASILRYSLQANLQELVTLAREMEIVVNYLELEKMRFEERLTVTIDVTPEASRAQIPVMLLQTVVENSMKHGIAHLPAGGEILIAAHLEDSMLHLDVRNGRPNESPSRRGPGTGLRNSEERLRLMYRSHASLELDLAKQNLAVTRIRIPQTG
jgi:LytS/YehU family sensor histidine kinase